MAVGWAKSQRCDFDFSTIDLDTLMRFDEAVAKVTEDLKMLKILPADAKTFNSFPKDFSFPVVPSSLENHVRAYLSTNDLPTVPHLSKRTMKEYSTLNFDVGLLVPRGWFAFSSQSESGTDRNDATTDDDAASGPNDAAAET